MVAESFGASAGRWSSPPTTVSVTMPSVLIVLMFDTNWRTPKPVSETSVPLAAISGSLSVGDMWLPVWDISSATSRAPVPVLERVNLNSGSAITGDASGNSASMLTRGMTLPLVTDWSMNSGASLRLASSITSPLLGLS